MKPLVPCISIALLASMSSAFLIISPSLTQIRHDASHFISSHPSLNIKSKRQSFLKQSSDDNDDPSNKINIAIFSNENESFQSALHNHPFCKMTGVSLSIDWITSTDDKSWTRSELDILQNTDIACFSTVSSFKTYLSKLDSHLNVDPELPQEERRKLPNKPDAVGGSGSNDLIAACPLTETARECLNSGRWIANNIYYPKDGQAVELKTESLEDGEQKSEDVEEDVEIDVDVWAASVMQAAGDVMERKFWGGEGW